MVDLVDDENSLKWYKKIELSAAVWVFLGIVVLINCALLLKLLLTDNLNKTLTEKYGKDITIEGKYRFKYKGDEVSRVLITIPSEKEIISEVYYVLVDDNNQILKDQKLSGKETYKALVEGK